MGTGFLRFSMFIFVWFERALILLRKESILSNDYKISSFANPFDFPNGHISKICFVSYFAFFAFCYTVLAEEPSPTKYILEPISTLTLLSHFNWTFILSWNRMQISPEWPAMWRPAPEGVAWLMQCVLGPY